MCEGSKSLLYNFNFTVGVVQSLSLRDAHTAYSHFHSGLSRVMPSM